MSEIDKSKHTGIDCPVCGREFFVGDIINTGNINKINDFADLKQQRDDLLAACEEGLHECERIKMHCTCKHRNLGSLLQRIERIEAAIAKAKT